MHEEGSARELLAAGTEATIEAAFRTGDYDRAEPLLEAARSRAEEDGDRRTEAGAIDQLGWLTHFRALDGNLAEADSGAEEALFQRALAISREIGDQAGIAGALFGLGLVDQVLRRDWEAAIPRFREALALAGEHGTDILRSECERHVGFFYMVEDVQPEKAIEHLGRSLELRERWGDERWIPSGLLALGMAELAADRRDEALDHLGQALDRARAARLSDWRVQTIEEWLRKAESNEAAVF
jgi:tetratricopeptide (TPR) repeat protein